MNTPEYKWLVLVYYLPPEAGSARVRIWRKMKKLGMVSFRNSVYFLPFTEEHYEITQWLCQEISRAGGEATLLKAESVENLTDDEVAVFFRKARSEDFEQLAREAADLFERLDSLGKARDSGGSDVGAAGLNTLADDLKAMERRLDEIRQIDFFQAPGGAAAEEGVSQCRQALHRLHRQEEPSAAAALPPLDAGAYQGRTWVTRPRPYIDRIATAWAIRRLIDPEARFEFADDSASAPGAIPFDYIDADFSHHGEDCTLETVLNRFSIEDATVRAVAEIVHDIDLKDGKFGRCEAAGLESILKGLVAAGADDDALLEKGFDLFDSLLAGLNPLESLDARNSDPVKKQRARVGSNSTGTGKVGRSRTRRKSTKRTDIRNGN